MVCKISFIPFFFLSFNIDFHLWAENYFAGKGISIYMHKTLGKWNKII